MAFSQSTWNSQVGWVATDNRGPKDPQAQNAGGTGLSPVAENQTLGTPLKRRRMLRLRNIIRSKIRSGHPQAQTVAVQKEQTERAKQETGQISTTALKRDMSCRRAETINLYKGKLKGLTGNGHIRRKSINTTKSTADSTGDADPPLLGDIIDVPTTDSAAERSDVDSPFGSLTKSFASAVDKLDFHSTLPRNMSFLRSKSSFFNPKKGNGDGTMSKESGPQSTPTPPARPAPAPALYPIVPPSPTTSATPTPEGGSRSLPSVPRRDPPQASKAQDPRSTQPNQSDRNSRRGAPTPIVFSNEMNGYVASKPVSGYPRGVNPLRMHPPDTMAFQPCDSDRTASVLPVDKGTPQNGSRPQTIAPAAEIDTDSDSVSLEDAPIYSPSLGDLSQYARDTPRSANVTFSENSNRQAPVPTPTRSPIKNRVQAKGAGGVLKKSRSGVSLFGRSKQDRDQTGTGGALSQRDPNQKIGNGTGNVVKKSRSLHFGGLFKKDEQSDLQPTTMPSSPFQPATPSPLRKVMRYGSQSTKGGSSPTTLPTKKQC
ncbi:hypothetical protein H2200_007624 [Cladophialophora chaetospira]|uniref:Uncharacterized protein n=1 Tax=Cladophialophora chaetospira TaxID=386627 RepID=A0AA38X6I9_9EURO|nr:hypothetical protein H2200_007624 [Cladophialophora chaetospira]